MESCRYNDAFQLSLSFNSGPLISATATAALVVNEQCSHWELINISLNSVPHAVIAHK